MKAHSYLIKKAGEIVACIEIYGPLR